jgi:uncharacterized membrane protein YdjX (TVP38/TMEM64 family)
VLQVGLTARAPRRFLFFVAFVLVTGAVAALRAWTDLPLTPEAVRDVIRSWGSAAPLIFTAAFVLRPFLFFPSTLLFLAGGLAFGIVWGTLYATTGATLGAIVGFTVARVLGREFVLMQFGDRLPDLQNGRWGAGLVLLLNLIPVVPMTAINYGAGLSGIGLLPFTVAVAVGLTPRAFAYSFFGHSLLNIGSKEFVLALGFLLGLLIIPVMVRRQLNKRTQRETVAEIA